MQSIRKGGTVGVCWPDRCLYCKTLMRAPPCLLLMRVPAFSFWNLKCPLVPLSWECVINDCLRISRFCSKIGRIQKSVVCTNQWKGSKRGWDWRQIFTTEKKRLMSGDRSGPLVAYSYRHLHNFFLKKKKKWKEEGKKIR